MVPIPVDFKLIRNAASSSSYVMPQRAGLAENWFRDFAHSSCISPVNSEIYTRAGVIKKFR